MRLYQLPLRLPLHLALTVLASVLSVSMLACSPAKTSDRGDAATGDDAPSEEGSLDAHGSSDLTSAQDMSGAEDTGHREDATANDAENTGTRDAASGDVSDVALAAGVSTARPLGTTTAKNGFWEYLPGGYGDVTPRPLMVFWHGIGENGSGSAADLKKVPANGPPRLIAAHQWPATRPFVVLSPQHAGAGCPSATEIHDFITFALGAYDVDPKRVYLTGLSCGALGSASYLGQFGAQQVVAAVLISGDATPIYGGQGCALLGQMGLWAFHGDADPTVNIAGDNATMPKFLACPTPHKDAQYTVYPGVGHDAWTRTYDLSAGHDVYAWMLGFSR